MTWCHSALRVARTPLAPRFAAAVRSLLLCTAAWPWPAMAGMVDCIQPRSVEVMVRIGSDALPAPLLLAGGSSPALRLVDPHTGAVRWSASAQAPASQLFPDMQAGFSGSLAVVDLDGDGLHDRIYAGDLSGRLWRFDIHQGARPEALLTGGIFAALGGAPVVRAFLAPPDVSFSPVEGSASWINIAIGSASLSQVQELNRFYVLRDYRPLESWSTDEYRHWRPLTEADLSWTNNPERTAAEATRVPQAGFFVTLEHGSVVLPSITVSGRTFMAVAENFTGTGAECSIAVTISSLSLEDGRLISAADVVKGVGGPMKLQERIPANTIFRIATEPGASTATCRLGETEIPACAVSLRPVPLWWRREDAD